MWPLAPKTGPLTPGGHSLGWKPDLPDHRDLRFAIPKRIKIPDRVDLRQYCSTVEDQGNLGSCTANALVGALEVLENKKWGKWADLSRLFVYYNELAMEGSLPNDNGAYIRDGVKSLASLGVCLEKLWPYDIKKFAKKPCPAQYADAKKHTIVRYERVDGLDAANAALAQGFPVVFGFTVYENFEQIGSDGVMGMPQGSVLGGHAVLAVGYDLIKKVRIVRNSWSENWGDKGYFYMPDKYFSNPDLCDDMWVVYSANV